MIAPESSIPSKLAAAFSMPCLTARLDIRPLVEEDIDDFCAITNNPEIIDAIQFLDYPFNAHDAKDLLVLKDSGHDSFIGVWSRKEHFLIGVIGAHLRDDGELQIGYWSAAAHQGNGFATEAFSAVSALLRFHFAERRIVAECSPADIAFWRVLEKSGFHDTGETGRVDNRSLLALKETPIH